MARDPRKEDLEPFEMAEDPASAREAERFPGSYSGLLQHIDVFLDDSVDDGECSWGTEMRIYRIMC